MASGIDKSRSLVECHPVKANRQTGMTGLEWTPPAAPFFKRAVLSEWAVWDNGPRLQHAGGWEDALDWDALDWYVA